MDALLLYNGRNVARVSVRLQGADYDLTQEVDARLQDSALTSFFAEVPAPGSYQIFVSAPDCAGQSDGFALTTGQTSWQDVSLYCGEAIAAVVHVKVSPTGLSEGECDPIRELAVDGATQVIGESLPSRIFLLTKPEFADASVQWSTTAGLSDTTDNSAFFTCTAPGDFGVELTIDDQAGCTHTARLPFRCLRRDICGDGEVSGVEACEPSQQITCSSIDAAWTIGTASCTAGCTWDTSACADDRSRINGYFSGLPEWSSVYPTPVLSESPGTTGPAETGEPLPDDTAPSGLRRYSCTVTPYSLTNTPDKIVTFNPDTGSFWVGALLQGTGYVNGLGSLSELPVRERAPVRIWVDLLGPGVVEEVAVPDGASVQQAVSNLIGRAESAGVPPASTISYTMELANSTEDFFLHAGVSVKYMSVSVKGSLDTERKANERTLMAYFVQRAYTATVVTPQTPADWFSSDFSYDDLLEQERQGRLSSSNLPVYVSNVAYGRVLALSVTSQDSDTDIKAALDFSLRGGADVDVNTNLKYRQILSRSTIRIVSLGGDVPATQELIVSGQLNEYFKHPAPFATMRPISYQIVDVASNRSAKFGETTNYSLQQCQPLPNNPVDKGDVVSLKLTRARVATRTMDGRTNPCQNWPGVGADLYGTLRINGTLLWNVARSEYVTVQPGSFLEFDPDLELPETNPEQPGLRFLEAQGGSLLISGEINDHQGLDGDPRNHYNFKLDYPFAYGTFFVPATSNYCPVELEYQLTKLRDITEFQP